MLPRSSDDTERRTCAKRTRERLNTLKVAALAALSWPVPSLWSALHESGQFVRETVANNRDFLVGTAGAVATVAGSYYAYRASDEYKIQAAVQDFLKPYQPSDLEERVIKRPVMKTISDIITAWSPQTKTTTVVSGRYQSGKTVAVDEALREVRSVFLFTVTGAEWKEAMYKKMRVNDEGMFNEVLRQVRVELEKFPSNPTKVPILLLDIPREVAGGRMRSETKSVPLLKHLPAIC